MKCGVTFLAVFGLVYSTTASAELKLDGVSPSELKEIEKEIANGNVPPNYTPTDKLRRGAVKLTNTDSPTFNYIATQATNGAIAPAKATASPLRYVQHPYPFYQPQTYYQPQSYAQPLLQQNAHAAQIAAQYYNPSYLLQTPTQIQYVSTPTQVPTKYQTINPKTTVDAGASTAATNAAASSAAAQPAATPQYINSPLFAPQYYPQYFQQQAAAQLGAHAGAQLGAHSGAQTSQQLSSLNHLRSMYQQQPVVMLLINPSPYMYVPQHGAHHQQQLSYLLNQQSLLNLYGRQLGYPGVSPYTQQQVTYLLPMQVSAQQQQQQQQQQLTNPSEATFQDASKIIVAGKQDNNQQSTITFGTRTKS